MLTQHQTENGRGDKSALRQRLTAERRALGESYRHHASATICEKIIALTAYQNADTVAAFAPMPEEVNIWGVIDDAWQKGKTVALPRVADAAQRRLSFHQLGARRELVGGYKGIQEPPKKKPQIKQFDFIIVPAVAADKSNIRLGYGGGFYDIFLLAQANTAFSCVAIFHIQQIDVVPCEKHDQSVNLIITEKTTQ